jgi:hypothetical protein
MLLIRMQTSNPNPGDTRSYVLDFLVTHHPALFSVEELVREYTGQDDPERSQIGDFVFASRAAAQGRELAM